MKKSNFFRKGLVVGIIVLFIGLSIIPLSSSIKLNEATYLFMSGNTLYVGGIGLGLLL